MEEVDGGGGSGGGGGVGWESERRAKERRKKVFRVPSNNNGDRGRETEGLFLLQSRIVVWRAMTMKENG